MLRLRFLLGLLAAITLVIGGAPASASANPCNPCPVDCPMMAQMAKATSDPHAPAPGKAGNAENPCKSSAACQGAFVAPLIAQAAVETVWLAEAADHDQVGELVAPSWPPDPTLRPPIQL